MELYKRRKMTFSCFVIFCMLTVLDTVRAVPVMGKNNLPRALADATLFSQDFSAAANPALSSSSGVFDPSAMLSGVGVQAGTSRNPAGGNPQMVASPAGSPQIGSVSSSGIIQTANPAGASGQLQSGQLLSGQLGSGSNPVSWTQSGNPAGNPQISSNPGGVLSQLGNPAGNPGTSQSETSGYTQYGNPAGIPVQQTSGSGSVAASGIQQVYQTNPNSQDYTGQGYNPNTVSYTGSFDPNLLIGRRAPRKRFNPDVTNSELISNPNPVNVGIAYNPEGLMFVPGGSGVAAVSGTSAVSSSSGVSQTGSVGVSQTGSGFNPNTLPANQNPAGGFNPANPQTAGSFNPNAGEGFIPSNTQSQSGGSFVPGSSQSVGNFDPNAFSAGNFDPNSFSAGSFDPNAIPPAQIDRDPSKTSAGAGSQLFDPSSIGISNFPPNTQG